MELLIYDRIFWLYFLIVLFFVIIGITSFFSVGRFSLSTLVVIATLWLVAQLALLFMIYYGTCNQEFSSLRNTSMIILFIVLLIISVIWVGQLEGEFSPLYGSLILLIGILFIIIGYGTKIGVAGIIFLVIWWGLSMYAAVSE